MTFPQLSTVEFVILGHLLAGRAPAKRIKSLLHKTYEWQRTDFFSIIKRMAAKGLIEIHRYAPSDGDEIRQESWYELTESGRQHWRETYSFFRGVCDQWLPQAESIPVTVVPELKKLRATPKRDEVRVPNTEEALLVLREGAPEFVWIFAAARELDVLLLDLISAEMADYSPLLRELRLRTPAKRVGDARSEQRVPVNSAAANWIRCASTGRKQGPIFLSPKGKPWEEVNLRMHFSRLRKKLGLPNNVMMQHARAKTGQRLREEEHELVGAIEPLS